MYLYRNLTILNFKPPTILKSPTPPLNLSYQEIDMPNTRNFKKNYEDPRVTSSQPPNLDHEEPSEKHSKLFHNNEGTKEIHLETRSPKHC